MRSNIERVEAAKRRAAEIERRRRAMRAKLAVCGSAAASLAAIVALAFAMPAVIEGAHGAGSVFASGAAGYIVIGVLAFALGVAVTLLGVKLRAYWKPEGGDDRDDR